MNSAQISPSSYNTKSEEVCMRVCPKCGYEKGASTTPTPKTSMSPETPVSVDSPTMPPSKPWWKFWGGRRHGRTGRRRGQRRGTTRRHRKH
jgi:hypothetical protein